MNIRRRECDAVCSPKLIVDLKAVHSFFSQLLLFPLIALLQSDTYNARLCAVSQPHEPERGRDEVAECGWRVARVHLEELNGRLAELGRVGVDRVVFDTLYGNDARRRRLFGDVDGVELLVEAHGKASEAAERKATHARDKETRRERARVLVTWKRFS